MKIPRCDGSASDCNRAIKEIIRLEGRWSMLKQLVGDYSAKVYCEDDGPCTGEFKAGFDRALGWVEARMEELEVGSQRQEEEL